jgi:23S rRNA pseudouridine1911/1915/1917 synthase
VATPPINPAQVPFYFGKWPILYLDNHLFALYKPAGLLVQGDRSQDVTLLELGKRWLKEHYGKPGRVFLGLVHRLDRPVAGVVLFARTSKAAARISEQFRTGNITKRYLAIVEGHPGAATGRLINHLERRERVSQIVQKATQGSQEARLSYRVLDQIASQSLLGIDLETGRRHQIRLQLAHLGHPIAGDVRYGAKRPLPNGQIALLARELCFNHPTSHQRLTVASPLPIGWPWLGAYADPHAPPWCWTD